MKADFTSQPQFEIIKYLYQFKDDNKFYKLDESLLNIESHREKYKSIYTLRNNALIGTDREVYKKSTGEFFVHHFNNNDEIRARILPKGIAAIEAILEKEKVCIEAF